MDPHLSGTPGLDPDPHWDFGLSVWNNTDPKRCFLTLFLIHARINCTSLHCLRIELYKQINIPIIDVNLMITYVPLLIEIGAAIDRHARKSGLRVVPAFTGHGIGTYFHGPPDIYHCRWGHGNKHQRNSCCFSKILRHHYKIIFFYIIHPSHAWGNLYWHLFIDLNGQFWSSLKFSGFFPNGYQRWNQPRFVMTDVMPNPYLRPTHDCLMIWNKVEFTKIFARTDLRTSVLAFRKRLINIF